MRLGGVPDDVGMSGDEEPQELFLCLVRDETERELTQGHEVLVTEEARKGAGDLLGRVDVAVQHSATQLFGGRIDQLELVGPAHDPVGDPLAYGHAGDPLHGIRDALEMLDVNCADDGDSSVEDLENVLPTFRMRARTGDVGVCELVYECHLGLAGKDLFEVHLLEGRAPVVDDLARHHREVANLLSCVLAAMGLDEADDDVRAALVASPALVEHGPGLADAGHSSEVDAELARRLDALIDLARPFSAFGVPTHRSIPTGSPSSPSWPPVLTNLAVQVPRASRRSGRSDQLSPRGSLDLREGQVQLEDVDVGRAQETEFSGLALAGNQAVEHSWGEPGGS